MTIPVARRSTSAPARATACWTSCTPLERVNHIKVPYEIAPRRAGDPPTVFAKVGKAERLLHWKAKRTLDQMCADSWRWQTQNPHGFAKEK